MMQELKTVERTEILRALRDAMEPLDYVYAMWEGGAAAFDRVDAWSDIDLQIDVEDDRVADAVALFEKTLASVSPIELRYEIPSPTWHGHYQTFYRLQRASEFLLIDFVAMRHGNPNKFMEREIHGNPVVHFDKRNVTIAPPFDPGELADRLMRRVEALRVTFEMFRIFTLKEINRGNTIEALSFYQGQTLRPLVEALRIRHAPARYNFHTRYIQYDLPADIVAELEPLFFVAGPGELREKFDRAVDLFRETIEGIDRDDIMRALNT